MNLSERGCRIRPFDKGRIGYLRVCHSDMLIAACDPQKLILIKSIGGIYRILPVLLHLMKRTHNIFIRNPIDIHRVDVDLLLRRCPFGKHISVDINFFKIGKYGLPVLHDGKGGADMRYIVGAVFRPAEYQVCKIDLCIVIDLSLKILSRKLGIPIHLRNCCPLLIYFLPLPVSQTKTQLFNIIIRIPQLVRDTESNQDIGGQIRAAMGVEIRVKFHFRADIGLDQ